MLRHGRSSPKLHSRAAEKPERSRRPLRGEEDRARLTPTALKAIRSLSQAWRLTGDEAATLLGVSPSTWDRISANAWKQTLTQDQLTRISALVGIFKGLHLLFADDMADRWPRLANSGPLFQNLTPIAAMAAGRHPADAGGAAHVDALRGGL